MINVPLARKKSMLEHRSNNIPRTVKNVACAQPSVSHEDAEIQNSNFERVPSKHPSDYPEEDDRKPAAKRIKKEPEDDAQSVTQDEPKVETIVKPWEDKKDYVLEGVVATRRTSGQTVGPRVCSYVLVTLEVDLARN